MLLGKTSEQSQILPLEVAAGPGLEAVLCSGPACLGFAEGVHEEITGGGRRQAGALGGSWKVQSCCRSGIFRWICWNIFRYQSLGLSTLDRGAMGMPLSSTGPIPSYLTQRLSRRLLSLVHVADQLWACWAGEVFELAEGQVPGPGQV